VHGKEPQGAEPEFTGRSCGPAGEGDGVAEPAFPGCVEDGVDLAVMRMGVHLREEVGAVADGDRVRGVVEFVSAGLAGEERDPIRAEVDADRFGHARQRRSRAVGSVQDVY
jgi:hypothetical protein